MDLKQPCKTQEGPQTACRPPAASVAFQQGHKGILRRFDSESLAVELKTTEAR